MANPFFDTPRVRRMKADLQEMKILQSQSSILDFDAEGTAPDRYRLTFHGKGLGPQNKITTIHRITLSLGMNYPREKPDIKWETPIHHPNISSGNPCFGTFVMNPNVKLVDIVEILWDMARMAVYNPYGGYGEKDQWQVLRRDFDFPIDKRILRDKAPVTPKPPEEEGEAELIIMSGKKREPIDWEWAGAAIAEFMGKAGLQNHVLIFTENDWRKHGDGSGKGSVATMMIDGFLFDKLRARDEEASDFLGGFLEFLKELRLIIQEEVPGKFHFYPAKR